MSRAAWLAALVAMSCGTPAHEPAADRPVGPRASDTSAVTPDTMADPAGDAMRDAATPVTPRTPDTIDAAVRVVGRLRDRPATAATWVSRVCTAAGGLVMENDCGCNDALLCGVTAADPATRSLSLDLHKDRTRRPKCKDCFPMVPGRCELPPLTAGAWTVRVNDTVAFTLVVGVNGAIDDGICWK